MLLLFKLERVKINPEIPVWKSTNNSRSLQIGCKTTKASTWIYRVALFAAMTWARREKNRPQTRPLSEVEHVLTTTGRPGDDRLDWLYAQIALLNPVDRSLCLLLLDGYSYKEMAALLGISESNVGVKIHRIKQHLLRESLEKNHHGV